MGVTEKDMEDLPMIKILWRMPLKDQVRFKCVSKSWYALITFLQNQNVLLKREVTNEESGEIETRYSFFKYPFTADDDSSFEHLDYPRFGEEFKDTYLHGHSHGILCFSHGFLDIFLYNPTTGELRNLPPSILLSPNCLDLSTMDGVGFGYDPESRDFKAIRVVSYYGEFGILGPSRAELYDLGKDRWREIKTPIPGVTCSKSSFEMYYQGLFYWLALDFDDSYEIIMWFDMSKEVFGKILMPDACDFSLNLRSLGVLNGSIVLLTVPRDGHEKSFDVWEMVKDDDDGELEGRTRFSWTKLFTIGPVFGIQSPLVFVGSDQLLMEDEKGQLILCNIFNTQDCKQFPIKGHQYTIEAAPFFVKTLLSIKGGDS